MNGLSRALSNATLAARLTVVAATVFVTATVVVAYSASGLEQIPLTQDIINRYLAAEPDVRAVYHSAPGGNLAPEDLPKLEQAAAKHGFSTFNTYSNVGYSVSLAFSGIDPATKAYIGQTAVLKARIRDLKANAAIPSKEKADKLELLQSELDETPAGLPQPLPQNIELIQKNYAKIEARR